MPEGVAFDFMDSVAPGWAYLIFPFPRVGQLDQRHQSEMKACYT